VNLDIGDILRDWPYEPGKVTVRKIRGRDGREKIQLRLDLGLFQMETAGRPDGKHPHGCRSVLAYHQKRLDRYRRKHGSDEGFELDEDACEQLRAEAVMYYHRYLAEFVLEDYAAVERDTVRNLKLLDFVRAYAAEEADREAMQQYRPYMIMMHTRARGQVALKDNRPKVALAAVREGIERIGEFYEGLGQEKMISASAEIAVLRTFAREIEAKMPVDPEQKLKGDLESAVREERYEDAARLRDELRRMGDLPP
jgi:hypothetical protein